MKPLILCALLLSSLSSCIVVAGAGAGYLISKEVLPDSVHQAQVKRDVDIVWAQAQATVREMTMGDFQLTEYPRRIEADIDGASVEVIVEAFDLNRTIIKVSASRYLSSDNDVATEVLNTIVQDLEN